MQDAFRRAVAYVRERSTGGGLPPGASVTLNFHPDMIVAGRTSLELIARDGVYRSQFETGTSSGGLTAYRGGERWAWESRMFDGAYNDVEQALRPKYGALNYKSNPVGGSPRFGSCHLRVRTHVLGRTTFCYPDSHLHPDAFGVSDRIGLIELAESNELNLDPILDNYVEAHVHGVLKIADDVEVIILDPSYRDTPVEHAADTMGCAVEWHDGYCLSLSRLPECQKFRGEVAAEALAAVAVNGFVTPAALGAGRATALSYPAAKWAWHCVARFGRT